MKYYTLHHLEKTLTSVCSSSRNFTIPPGPRSSSIAVTWPIFVAPRVLSSNLYGVYRKRGGLSLTSVTITFTIAVEASLVSSLPSSAERRDEKSYSIFSLRIIVKPILSIQSTLRGHLPKSPESFPFITVNLVLSGYLYQRIFFIVFTSSSTKQSL